VVGAKAGKLHENEPCKHAELHAHGGSDQGYQRICVEPQGPIKHDEPLRPTPGAIKTRSAPGKVVTFVDLPLHEFRLDW
jgi:hypothetical protein